MSKVKREREEPCAICNHYHDYEGGEPCSVCGHRLLSNTEERVPVTSAFPSEIIPDFLFLGSYDNASRAELLKAMGIRYILNCVPTCQVLYKNSFTYHTASAMPPPLQECIDFIELARSEGAKILVHCMSGITRSPAIVIAYLMKLRGWKLVDSVKWVMERRPSVQLNADAVQQLISMEQDLFGAATMAPDGTAIVAPSVSNQPKPFGSAAFTPPGAPAGPSFNFGRGGGGDAAFRFGAPPAGSGLGDPARSQFVFGAPSPGASAGGAQAGDSHCTMDE
mmetsp:Transcript_25200/g.65420  ORF Transcript_25200/g.65420 Transcript_25200/m.65420 type:complete len:279 (-) Transcript_25200:127-963(-)